MKMGERKAVLLSITENIEMELFSSEEPCAVTTTQEEEEQSFNQGHLDHPLVPDCEEEPEPELVQSPPRQQAKPKTEPPVETELQHHPPLLVFMEEIEIEMEVFPPIKVSETELVDNKSCDPSIMTSLSPNKASRLKWKRLTLQKSGLVVTDVVCLPRGHHLAQLERHTVPRSKQRAALTAAGLTARITIDYGWSANQMESRLAMLFRGRFVKRAAQRFAFTYLQCVPGSGVLFVPDTPVDGWTAEQVLRICGHGALYIVSHQDNPQAECEKSASKTSAVNRKEFCPEASTKSGLDKNNQLGRQNQPCVPSTTDEDGSISGVRLPHASTCTLELFLPRGAPGPADLLVLQSRAVHEALGFTHFQTEGDGEGSRIDVVTS